MESVASPELAGSLDGAAQESSVASLELATGVQIRVPHKQKDKFITVAATDIGYVLAKLNQVSRPRAEEWNW
jgi:hypothetical protein